jgi:hypothetical protein
MATIIYCRDDKTVYIIHDPSTYITGTRMEKWVTLNKKRIEEQYGIEIKEIIRLNIGTEWDWEKAEEIDNNENCEELKI